MSATILLDQSTYGGLLWKAQPHVIHSDEENENYTRILETLLANPDRSPEEDELLALLTLLIEDYEQSYSLLLPASSPLDVVRFLMESNDLRQVDMTDVFGTPSVVSEVLSGKRDLAKSHIEKLVQRFDVSPELFFDQRR